MREIKITGEIIPFCTDSKNTSLITVQNQLKNARGIDLKVRINCKGGDVDEGFAIYSELRRYASENKVKVITSVEGSCDSIATVIFLAGDERVLFPNSRPLFHEAWLQSSGNSKELRLAADVAERASKRMAEFYSLHTSLSYSQAREIMRRGKVLTIEECMRFNVATKLENSLRPVALYREPNESPMSLAIKQFKQSKAKKPEFWLDVRRNSNVSRSANQIRESKFQKVIESIQNRK